MPYKDPEKRKSSQRLCYERNKEKRLDKQRKKENRRRYILSRYKVKKGCSECGYNKHPSALDFHHTKDKVKGIPAMLSHSRRNLFNEIRKCTILCSNCHRIEHSKDVRL